MFFQSIRNGMEARWRDLADRCIVFLGEKGVTPNTLTVAGLVLSLASAILFGSGSVFFGGVVLLLAGFMDTLDGGMARYRKQTSPFGALFDSTLDRYSEFIVFCGLLVYFREDWMFYVVFLGLMGSIMVSYVRARTHSLGVDVKAGWAQRPERLGMLITGSILNAPLGLILGTDAFFRTAILAVAFFSNLTAVRRLIEGRKRLLQPDGEP